MTPAKPGRKAARSVLRIKTKRSGGQATPERTPAPVFVPLTAARWADLVDLFGPRGACAGCWCMWPRLRGAEYKRGLGDPNKRALERIVRRGDPVGVLAYAGGEPVGWCGIAPREHYPRLAHSRVMAPVDDRPVWSVTCFFIRSSWRGRGLTTRLLEAAVRWAGSQGATMVEGYPVDTRSRTGAAFLWTGLASTFESAGFEEAARRSPTRPIMRRAVRASASRKPAATPRRRS